MGAVIYFRNGLGEYYSIDLDCLPEKVSPITTFSLEKIPGWTASDDKCIYWIGGLVKEDAEKKFTRAVGMSLHKYKYNTNTTSTLECLEPKRSLGRFEPSVFAFEKKIYVVGGYEIEESEQQQQQEDNTNTNTNTNWRRTRLGEYYNLDSRTWHCLPEVDYSGSNGTTTQVFLPSTVARVMDDETTILFYSGAAFLFYDLVNNAWKPSLVVPFGAMDGLEECDCLDILYTVISNSRPVVCHSTLYWFNNDECLYGFDYVRGKWFQSHGLKLNWPLSLDPETLWHMPLLFYLDNQTFVAIAPTANTKELALAMAFITVERDSHLGFLNVSLKSSHNIAVETSHLSLMLFDGMTILKDEGSTTTNNNNMLSISGKDEGSMRGKRKFTLED